MLPSAFAAMAVTLLSMWVRADALHARLRRRIESVRPWLIHMTHAEPGRRTCEWGLEPFNVAAIFNPLPYPESDRLIVLDHGASG